MWIREPGRVNEHLTLLGTFPQTLYLLEGDPGILLGGGSPWLVPELEQQIRDLQIDMDRVRYLLVGHLHYDHCGAVPYFRKKYPHLEILASPGAQEILCMDKAIRNIRNFSRMVMETKGRPLEFEGISLEFEEFPLHRVLKDGDRIDLGDLELEVFEAPGHSRCSLIVYEPNRHWLFPSDSLAIPDAQNGDFLCTASESFVVYLESLKKVVDLDVELCAWEHHGLFTKEDARDIVRRGMRYTVDIKRRIRELVEESDDTEQAVHWMAKDWLNRSRFDFLPYDIMVHITRRMVQKAMEEETPDIP